jgi:hypothetical protein
MLHEQRRLVLGALKHDLLAGLWFCWLDLLSWLLHLLAGSFKFHQRYSLGHTYCMHVHKMSLMYA